MIHLIPSTRTVTAAQLEARFPAAPLILACDFYLEGIERVGEAEPWGLRAGRVLSVDHHAPVPAMQARISSTNLALRYVAARGPAPEGAAVVVNHTDCDSVLSAGIVAGRLPPLPRLGEAAVAADHTGEPDEVADVLQAVDAARDLELSFDCVRRLLEGRPLPAAAAAALERRRAQRREAEAAVAGGRFRRIGMVWLGIFAARSDGAFLPALLPDAGVIVAAHPLPGGRWAMKARLGLAAPPGVTLHSVGMRALDPAWGGRWNAGGNGRAQGLQDAPPGSAMEPEAYARAVAERYEAACAAAGHPVPADRRAASGRGGRPHREA